MNKYFAARTAGDMDILLRMIYQNQLSAEQNRLKRFTKSITEIISEHYAQTFECLDSISCIGVKSAEIIISEAGKDMSRFPTADNFTARRGLAPGTNESAGKRKNTLIKKCLVLILLVVFE